MNPGTGRSRLAPDSEERFTSLRRELGATALGINQMILQPGQRTRIHRHERQEEIYLVISGELTVEIEGQAERVSAGELMRVAPDVRRQLINRGRVPVLLVALGADGEHDGRDAEAFRSWEQTDGESPRDVPFPDDLATYELGG